MRRGLPGVAAELWHGERGIYAASLPDHATGESCFDTWLFERRSGINAALRWLRNENPVAIDPDGQILFTKNLSPANINSP